MIDDRDLFERAIRRFPPPERSFDRLISRRARKRRNQRLAAGAVGLAIIALAAVLVGTYILRADGPVPVEQPPVTEQILREGEVLQFVDENGPMAELVATDPATGHQRILQGCSGRCGYMREFALSTDGGWIAWEEACASSGCGPPSATEGGLWVVGADGSPIPVANSAHHSYPGWVWAWSPAADQLAFVTGPSGRGELVLFDPSTGERTSLMMADGISALSWSPDGTAIAIAVQHSDVSVFDLATGRSTSIARIGYFDDHDLSWSPDGTRLLLETHGTIIVVNADGSDRRVLAVDADSPGAPAWSPDGTRIAYLDASGPGLHAEVWVIGADGSDATRVFQAECCLGDGSGPVWSPDGSRIAFWIHDAVPFDSQLVVNADGTGSPEEVDDVVVDGWIQG